MLTKSLKWFFAKNDGGRETGFKNAGVETFKGNITRYLAREILQNSLDARSDAKKPVHVTFELVELGLSDIPDIRGLRTALERCADYFKHQKQAMDFFTKAVKLASTKPIVALKASDFNTVGVTGADDDNKSPWYSLVRCEGSSTKGDDEGGSFGLGKNAPFAASQMRTVLYSTYNADSEHVFQGVATLTSHRSNGTRFQPTGYLGIDHGESVRKKKLIPEQFLRSKPGTDLYVLGFAKSGSWQKDLTFAVLEHFWPAIDFGDLTVTVGDQEVTKKNLGELLTKFAVEEEFTAHNFYKAYSEASSTAKQDLPTLKDVQLHLSTGEDELPNRVAMIRKPGMVVFQRRFRSVVPYCGVFLCRNEFGNRVLRDMEPPRHDDWDHDRPEKGANKKTEVEYVRFIRDCIHGLNATDESKVLAVPGLSKFLPDDEDSPEEAFDDSEMHGQESADRSPLKPAIEGRKIDPRHTATRLDLSAPGDDALDGEGAGGGTGDGGGNGGGGEHGGDGKAKTGGERQNPGIPIRYRTYATGPGVYAVTVQSEDKSAQNATLTVWAVGDQGKNPPEIASAALRDGKALSVRGGQVGPITLPSQKSVLHLTVTLRQPVRLAMEVAAHAVE